MPTLTYIIPAFNAEATLEQAVRSVLLQSVPGVEAVVVDDGSTDSTRHIAGALLGPRVRLCSHQRNSGLACARNTGWQQAEADHVCFLDADDTVSPEHAATMLEAIGTCDAVASCYEFVGPALEPLGWHAPVLAGDTAHDRLIEVNRLAIGSVVLRRDCASRLLNGSMFDESLRVHEDWEFLLRLAAVDARWAPPVEQPLFRYRLSPGSMSCDLSLMWRIGLDVIERHAHDEYELAEMARRWHVRALARAIAAEDFSHTNELRCHVKAIREEDLPTLAGTLRWALARQEAVGPRGWGARMGAWTTRALEMLDGEPMAGEIARRLAFGPHRWGSIMERAKDMLAPGEPLVIYGYGRNGRDAVRAAADLGLTIAVVDDDPRALGKVPAIRADQLLPKHLVLVTPESRDGIIQRLRERGVERIILPDAA
ncbi:MAG: glycosyltransferase [Planctomycetota bacterium]|nr:glycosyltransferase [Planctomycetota bacterium]